MHPDRATTDVERVRRNVIMAQINVAYAKGDQAAIETNYSPSPLKKKESIARGQRGIYLIKSPLTPIFQRGGLNTYIEKLIFEFG